jgi:Aldo/keto reductase family
MALAPWGALGGGQFKTDEQRESQEGRKMGTGPSDRQIKVSKALEHIADRKGTIITSVALAYVMHKAPYVFPIVGGRKIEHLKGNIEALSLELSDEEIQEIDNAAPFDVGFPMNFLFEFRGRQKYSSNMTGADIAILQSAVNLDAVSWPRVSLWKTLRLMYRTNSRQSRSNRTTLRRSKANRMTMIKDVKFGR